MPTIFSLVNQKGGVGKTTIATNLAMGLASLNAGKVLLVDADVSQSATLWFSRRTMGDVPFARVPYPSTELYKALPQLIRDGQYEYIVIDCPAGSSKVSRAAMMLSDVVIIPFQPSQQDIDASEILVPLLDEVRSAKPSIVYLAMINRRPASKNNFATAGRLLLAQFIEANEIDAFVLETEIYERNDIKKAYLTGKTVFELGVKSKSAIEFSYLTKEILECLQPILQ